MIEAAPFGVVVADDHPMVVQGLVAVIDSTPGAVLLATATTGREALQACREHRPEVAVIDIAMPDMDGIEATRRIVRELPDTRVVILSMHDDDEALFGALRAGAHAYLVKGANREAVAHALQAVAAGEAVFNAAVAPRLLQQFGATPPPLPDALGALSDREREVLELLAQGKATKEVASKLFVSPKTVRNHVANIVAKLQVTDRANAIALARRQGAGTGKPRRH